MTPRETSRNGRSFFFLRGAWYYIGGPARPLGAAENMGRPQLENSFTGKTCSAARLPEISETPAISIGAAI